MMEREERITLFCDMVLCCHDLYLWEYDGEMNLLQSNCPEVKLITRLVEGDTWKSVLRLYADRHDKPIIMSNAIGLCWVAIPYHEGDRLERIYVLGPFSVSDISSDNVADALRKLRLPTALQVRVAAFVASLPLLSLNRVFEYAIMLYYCITGDRILVSDLHYQESESAAQRTERGQSRRTDVHGTYAMEQEMVRMVREGNLDYQKQISRLAVTGNIGKLSDNADRQMKNAVLVCIVLFSRAAVEGGVPPEIAMTLTDHYFQSVEACRGMQELQTIARTMQDDFVQRVHRVRQSKLSRPIQECCDYLDMHLEEAVTLKEMAAQLGYSEYYLSHKFRREMGISFREHLSQRRLAKAPDLLRNSALTVRDVSERLHFCSPSYFAEQFRAVYGVSPSEWRAGQ